MRQLFIPILKNRGTNVYLGQQVHAQFSLNICGTAVSAAKASIDGDAVVFDINKLLLTVNIFKAVTILILD